MTVIILAVLVLGFWLGVWAAHVNLVKPLQETETELWEELGKVRRELERRDLREALRMELWQAISGNPATPRIERREHSDVFKIDSIDALIEGSR